MTVREAVRSHDLWEAHQDRIAVMLVGEDRTPPTLAQAAIELDVTVDYRAGSVGGTA